MAPLRIARKDAAQGAVFRAWIDDQLLPRFEGRILAYDTVVAKRCTRLYVGDPCAERDAMIAATAIVHGLTIVTRDIADSRISTFPCSIRGFLFKLVNDRSCCDER